MPEKNGIAAALVEAQASAQPVEKGSENSFHRYKYASAEALMAEGRKALTEAGLVLACLGWELVDHGDTPPDVVVRFRLWHGPSGESIDWPVTMPAVPEKGRPIDKAVSTALTYAQGYAIRGLLCLPRVDGTEDVDQRDDRDHTPTARRPPSRDSGNLPIVIKPKVNASCATCGTTVHAGTNEGVAAKLVDGGKWQTYCREHWDPEAKLPRESSVPDDERDRVLAEIKGVLKDGGLMKRDAARDRAEALSECFGTDDLKEIATMPVDDLLQGLSKLKDAASVGASK